MSENRMPSHVLQAEAATILRHFDEEDAENTPDGFAHITHYMMRRARALLEQIAASPWLRADDAPRDGTHFLACDSGGVRRGFMKSPPTVVHWHPDPERPGFYTSVNETEPQHPFPVALWCPLPPEPGDSA